MMLLGCKAVKQEAQYISCKPVHLSELGRLQHAAEFARLNDCKLQVRDLPAAT